MMAMVRVMHKWDNGVAGLNAKCTACGLLLRKSKELGPKGGPIRVYKWSEDGPEMRRRPTCGTFNGGI